MEEISGKWVALGAVITIVLNQVESYVLLEPVGTPLMNSCGLLGGLLLFAGIIAVGSFFVGGIVIGRMSPGVTVKEAGYAALIAVAINVLFNTVTTGHFPGILGVGIVAGIGYGLGIAGGRVGEAWQARAEGHPQPIPQARAVNPPGFPQTPPGAPPHGPPQGGFPPQGGGFPPPQGGGFPPPQGGQGGGFPPPQGGQGGGFPPPQGGAPQGPG